MAERSYPLGNRRRSYKTPTKEFDEGRFAWTTNYAGQFVIMVNPVEDGSQAGPNVRLFHPIPGKNFNLSLDLTNLTEEEILTMKELFDAAFEWAIPVVRQRDKEAADAFARGDDSRIRNYRTVPQLVFRKRPVEEYGQSVLNGSPYVPPVDDEYDEPDDDLADGVQRPSNEVVERHEGNGEPKDDWPTVDQPPSLQ